jgi:hypothetical protein
LANKKVLVKVDNMAAKKWVRTNRLTRGASWADSFMSVFSIYCAAQNIYIISEHVAGIDNDIADDLSRIQSLQESWLREDTEEEQKSSVSQRGEISRRFFKACVETRSRAPLPTLLTVVEALLGIAGPASA